MTTETAKKFGCQYCLASFKREVSFMRHKCKEMERMEELRSISGQSAYALYCDWMKELKRKPPPIETFADSMYYTAFIKFEKFVKDVGIIRPKSYIRVMQERKISPTLWARNESYRFFIEWNDKVSPPDYQAEVTVDTLCNLASKHGISVHDIFIRLHPREIIQLIRERKLSMWVLLHSSVFKQHLQNYDLEDRKELNKLVDFEYWADVLHKPENEQTRVFMKEITNELGI